MLCAGTNQSTSSPRSTILALASKKRHGREGGHPRHVPTIATPTIPSCDIHTLDFSLLTASLLKRAETAACAAVTNYEAALASNYIMTVCAAVTEGRPRPVTEIAPRQFQRLKRSRSAGPSSTAPHVSSNRSRHSGFICWINRTFHARFHFLICVSRRMASSIVSCIS